MIFPKGFLWGSATSAHQVEGNCDRNHWWEWEQEGLRASPRGHIRDGSVSGIACDYYHRFDEDHRLAAARGMATLDDDARTCHLRAHLEEVARAIRDGVDVRGYFYWSLMDNFEWAEGYARHFGLVAVDKRTLERRPRPTAFVYRDVITANAL